MTFVDSPGLVDGDMKYPFDVDEVILWLGQLAQTSLMADVIAPVVAILDYLEKTFYAAILCVSVWSPVLNSVPKAVC